MEARRRRRIVWNAAVFFGRIRSVNKTARKTIAYCAPFAVWTVLMTFLPKTAGAYALRAAATAVAGIASMAWLRQMHAEPDACDRGAKEKSSWTLADVVIGIAAGLFVFAFWVAPAGSQWYQTWLVMPIGRIAETTTPSPYDPSACGWWLTWAKILGSAFVIAPAEELFFRSFLYRWVQMARDGWTTAPLSRFNANAFAWTVALFACEHAEFAVAAACGVVYGLLAIRRSLKCAICAHATTNFVLGLYVVYFGHWNFW